MAHDKQLYSKDLDKLYKEINNLQLSSLSSSSSPTIPESNNSNQQPEIQTQNQIPSTKKPTRFKFRGNLKSTHPTNNKKDQQKKDSTATSIATTTTSKTTTNTSNIERLQDTFTIQNISNTSDPIVYNDKESIENRNLLIDNISDSVIQINHNNNNNSSNDLINDQTHNYYNYYYSSAKIRNISQSVIQLSDEIRGPVYVESVHDSIIVVESCQQFRMHDSQNTIIIVSCESQRPIIEQCHDLLFGQIGEDFNSTATMKNNNNNNKDQTKWITVDDFNWLVKSKQSENWKKLELGSDNNSTTISDSVSDSVSKTDFELAVQQKLLYLEDQQQLLSSSSKKTTTTRYKSLKDLIKQCQKKKEQLNN